MQMSFTYLAGRRLIEEHNAATSVLIAGVVELSLINRRRCCIIPNISLNLLLIFERSF